MNDVICQLIFSKKSMNLPPLRNPPVCPPGAPFIPIGPAPPPAAVGPPDGPPSDPPAAKIGSNLNYTMEK